jgi:sulfur-oxidizing protein SoxY
MRSVDPVSGSRAVPRRRFLGLAAAGLVIGPRLPRAAAESAMHERLHQPVLGMPSATSNGVRVPIRVDVPHPMDPDHHVSSLQVINPRDPVPLKGVFHFTPRNGRAHVAFQTRLDEGSSTVLATADCGRHGRHTGTAAVAVAEGGGGCAGGPPPAIRMADEIRPPVIRIPALVAERRIHAGDIIDIQVKTKHPNRTGLVARDGTFVQEAEPFHLSEMDVFYGGERVSHFALTAALSDNVLIAFKLRAGSAAAVRVTLTNTRGQRFEASHPIPVL